MKNRFQKILITILALALILQADGLMTNAAALTTLSDTPSRLKASTVSNHDLRFRSITGMSSGTIVIDFNTAGFTSGSTVYTDIDLYYGSSQVQVNGSCSSSCTNATIATSAGSGSWGAAFATNNLTLTYPTSGGTAIAANDYVRVLIGLNASGGAHQMTNPTVGSKTISVTAGSDSGKIGVVIITDDQISVAATVDPSLTFAIGDLTVGFGSFVGTAVRYATGDLVGSATIPANGAPVTLAASTNATSGWNMAVLDSDEGLYSSVLSETISATVPGSVTDGSKTYAVYGKNAGSGVTISEAMDGDGTTDSAIGLSSVNLASTSAPSASVGLDLVFKAAVDATTKAGQYSDTVSVSCTANY